MPAFLMHDRLLRIVVLVSVSVTLLGCAIVVGVSYAKGLNPISLTGDSKGYILLAQNLLEHRVFSLSEAPYAPESFRAPGFSFFLAGLFSVFGVSLVALFVHALIMSLAPILLFILTRGYHERAAFWGSILFAFEPVRLFLSASFLSDAFFTVLFLFSLVVLENARTNPSWQTFLGIGLLLSALILVRPIAIFLPLVYAAYLIVRMRPLQIASVYAALMVAVALIGLLPWMARNYTNFGSWAISSVGNANLVLYNAPEFLKWKPDARGQSILDQFNVEQAALPRAEALSLARNEVFINKFREIIRGHEISYMFFHVVKTIPFFVTDGLRDTIRLFNIDIGTMPNISTALMRGDIGLLFTYLLSGGLPIALLVIGSGFWTLITLVFGLESIRALIRRDVFPLFLTALVCYFALLTGPVSNARYRVPIEGLMLVLSMTYALRWYYARHGHA